MASICVQLSEHRWEETMKRHFTTSTLLTVITSLLVATVTLGSVAPGLVDLSASSQENRALGLIEKARAALGGDKLKSVQSLSVNTKFRRIIDKSQPEMSGETQFDLLLPDKFMSTEEANLRAGGATLVRITGVNGDQPFRDASTRGGGGGAMMVVRAGPDGPEAQAGFLKSMRAELARYALAWLLTSPAPQTEFTYVGEAEAEEGRAEVIDAKSPDGFAVRLFLDKKSFKPLLISYQGPQPNMVVRSHAVSAASREDAEKQAKELKEQADKNVAAQGQPKMVEFQMFLSDYREVDGIQFPHQISRSINGEVAEEFEVTRVRINPPLNAEQFKK